MEQLNIEGIISNTSKKGKNVDGSASTRKTAYLTLDNANALKAETFGLTEYTPRTPDKDTGKITPYFMVMTTEVVDVYNGFGEVEKTLDGGVDTPNFHSNGETVNLAILKGDHKGNTFYRLKGIQGLIEEVEPQNLFASTSIERAF